VFYCRSPEIAQKETLLSFLKKNADSTNSRRLRLSEIKSVEQFRTEHRLTRYDFYKELVESIESGEDVTALSTPAPVLLAPTSGTTGLKWFTDRSLSLGLGQIKCKVMVQELCSFPAAMMTGFSPKFSSLASAKCSCAPLHRYYRSIHFSL